MSGPKQLFSRGDLHLGLKDLISRLDQDGEEVSIRIVGGAAIALAYDADRRATVDIDAQVTPSDVILKAARDVAASNNWRRDWFNTKAEQFLPNGFGMRSAEWNAVYVRGKISVYVATPETLFAMKCFAAQRRSVRELPDLRVLAGLAGITTVEEAEELFGQFYPGDEFSERTAQVVEQAVLGAGPPADPVTFPDLDR